MLGVVRGQDRNGLSKFSSSNPIVPQRPTVVTIDQQCGKPSKFTLACMHSLTSSASDKPSVGFIDYNQQPIEAALHVGTCPDTS